MIEISVYCLNFSCSAPRSEMMAIAPLFLSSQPDSLIVNHGFFAEDFSIFTPRRHRQPGSVPVAPVLREYRCVVVVQACPYNVLFRPQRSQYVCRGLSIDERQRRGRVRPQRVHQRG